MTRYLLVPGRGVPLAGHWMRAWAEKPGYRWAPEPPGPPYVVDERIEALRAAVDADDTPAILIAHSAGCLTVARWAARHEGPIHAALLVTPPFIRPEWMDVPRRALPFRSVLVASRTDPHCTMAQARAHADDWGAELVDAGDVGHLDSATGFGPWPDGEALVGRLDGH
ncbi:MAG TPA: alpha/beta hydrolase [Asanoa sp.]|nr:alpha/beta hydrolase [Asanoa sp.]